MQYDMNEVLAAEMRVQRIMKLMERVLIGANVLAIATWLYVFH